MISTPIELLDELSRATGVEYDPSLARQVVRQVEREVAGPASETWADRLILVGREFGLRIQPTKADIRQAMDSIRPGAPVVVFVPSREPDDAGGSWWVFTDRKWGKSRVVSGDGRRRRWVGDRELRKILGLGRRDETTLWALVQSAVPCDAMRSDEHHGADHSSEHGPAEANGHGHIHSVWPDPRRGRRQAGNHPTPFQRLRGLVQVESRDIFTVILFAFVVGILSLSTPIAVEALVQMVAFGGLAQPVIVISALLLGVLGLAAAIIAFQTYVVEILQRRVFTRVVADLAYRLPRVRVDAFDRHNAPEMVNRFFEVLTIQKAASTLLLDGVSIIITALIGMSVLAFYHPFLLGYDVILASLILFALFVLGRGAVSTCIRESWAKYAVAAWLEDLAMHPQSFRVNGGQEFALDRADTLTREYLRARTSHFSILMRQIIFALSLQAIAGTALLGLGGWLVVEGEMTLGQLVAAELIVTVIVGSFAKFGKHLETFYDLLAAVEKLGHLIDLPLERAGGEGHRSLGAGAAVRLLNVSYTYPGRHHEVLSGVNLGIVPGEWVAVAGASGTGKSTLIDLLYGLREPDAGAIELDGVDTRDIRLDSLRQHVAVVKGFEIIEGSVIENVRMGREQYGLAQVRDALAASGLLEDVRSLPDGLQTRLTSASGGPLSHGQARRLILAALLGDPRLLIIDELLDSLDVNVRDSVCDTLFDRTAARTLIVITHNQDIARRCDRVFQLDHGKLDELPTVSMDSLLGWKAG